MVHQFAYGSLDPQVWKGLRVVFTWDRLCGEWFGVFVPTSSAAYLSPAQLLRTSFPTSRKPWTIAIAICCTALLLVYTIVVWVRDEIPQIQNAVTIKRSPVAFVAKRDLDVGIVKPGETLEDCVILRNAGIVPLRALPGVTGCRAPHPVRERLKIMPGGQVGIDVRIDSSAEPGAYTHSFIVHTDDPHNAGIWISMTYTIVDPKSG